MGLFVYLPCVNTAALNVAFHKSYCYSVWAYLYFILGPTALNVKVICVNVYYLAQLRWYVVKVQSHGRNTQNRTSYSNWPDGTKQTI